MNYYKEWSSFKTGDKVKRFKGDSLSGTVISSVGVGYVVKLDNGKIEKITNGILIKA